jgi:hypothetical protein
MNPPRVTTNRRGFLSGLGALALAPALEAALHPRVARGAGAPAKALFVYVPDGCIPQLWHPTGTETNFVLPAMSEPLNAIKSECTFVDGLEMFAGGATHEGGVRKVLTATGAQSLDVWLGRQTAAQVPFASLHLGVGANFENGSGSMSFVGAGQEMKPEDNPLAAFDRLFGGAGATGSAAAALVRQQEQSLLDRQLAELTALRARVGNEEKAKLDLHLTAVRDLERRLQSGAGAAVCSTAGFNAGGFRVADNDYYPKTFHREDRFKQVGQLQQELAVLALACGRTRVASLMWSHPVSPTKITEAGSTLGNHDASHYGSPGSASANAFVAMRRWFMQRFVELVQRLAATPDPAGGRLLDHTVVVLCSELGDGNNHDHRRVPFVVAGGRGLGLRPGRFLDLRGRGPGGANVAHAKLLVSVARACGQSVDTFGYDGQGPGGLAL